MGRQITHSPEVIMAKLKLRGAKSASGKKSRARAQGGKAQGGTPNSGSFGGTANSDTPF